MLHRSSAPAVSAEDLPPDWRSSLGLVDLAREIVAGVSVRPMRSALTALGAVVGVSAFAAVIGLANTARAHVNGQFTALAATEVVVSDTMAQPTDFPFPANTEQSVDRLHGVVSSGVVFTANVPQAPGVTRLAPTVSHAASNSVEVMGASPGVFRVAEGSLAQGRFFDQGNDQRREQVTVLGAAAAQQLGIRDIAASPAVFIDGVPFTVVGILRSVQREPRLLQVAIVPDQTALARWGPPTGSDVIIGTKVGSASVVASEAVSAILPQDPNRLAVVSSTGTLPLQAAVSGDMSTLLLLASGVALLLGMIGIASVTTTSVLERFYEIGVRRAMGATRRHIAAQFLGESVLLGAIGGVVGTCLAVIVIVILAGSRHWIAVLTPAAIIPDPLIGAVAGCVAGIYPATRAALLDPVEALRR